MPLVGTVPLRFFNRAAVTCTDFSYDFDIPTQNKAGGYGQIGTSQGVGSGTFSFKIVPRQENGLEFPIETLTNGEMPINFPIGTMRFALLGAVVSKHALSVQQAAGNTEFSVNGVFREFRRTR